MYTADFWHACFSAERSEVYNQCGIWHYIPCVFRKRQERQSGSTQSECNLSYKECTQSIFSRFLDACVRKNTPLPPHDIHHPFKCDTGPNPAVFSMGQIAIPLLTLISIVPNSIFSPNEVVRSNCEVRCYSLGKRIYQSSAMQTVLKWSPTEIIPTKKNNPDLTHCLVMAASFQLFTH